MLLCGCSVHQDHTLAQQAVSRFHAQLNREQFTRICDEASDDLGTRVKRNDILHLLRVVRTHLGQLDSTRQINWTVNYGLHDRRVTLVYRSQFDAGTATEQFVYRIRNDAARLVSYTIHSRLLALGDKANPAYAI